MKNNKRDNRSFEKLKTLILSVIFSIILWVAIVNIVNPDVTENFKNIPIQLNGVPQLREKGFVVVNTSELPECSVKVRGKRKNLIESAQKIYAVVNVSDINRQGTVLTNVIINSPSSINLEKQSISTIELEIEPCYEKDIPIVIRQEEVTEENLIKSVPENQTIQIKGSKKDLEKVEKCLVTANLSEIASDTNTMYPFTYLGDGNEQISKPDTIYCKDANILVYHTVYDKKTAKADLKIQPELSEDFRIDIDMSKFAEKEIAYGTKDDVKIDKIVYNLHASSVKEGENKIKLKAEPIDDVYIPENQLVLTFNAKKLETKKVKISLTTENLEDGYEAKDIISDSSYSLTGTKDELSDVKAKVNLKGLLEGTHRLPLEFDNKKIQPAEPCFATVVITRKED